MCSGSRFDLYEAVKTLDPAAPIQNIAKISHKEVSLFSTG